MLWDRPTRPGHPNVLRSPYIVVRLARNLHVLGSALAEAVGSDQTPSGPAGSPSPEGVCAKVGPNHGTLFTRFVACPRTPPTGWLYIKY